MVLDVLSILSADPAVISVEEQRPEEPFAGAVRLFSLFYRSDGLRVAGYLSVPKEADGPAPAVIFNRGGNREFGLLHPNGVCRLSARGYVALGSQYRGNGGGEGQEEFGGAEINDVIALVDLCQRLPFVKQGGVYMQGHSRGGMTTYLCCARDSRIKAAAVGAGMSDCVLMYNSREQSMKDVFHDLVGGSPEQLPEAFRARSAVCWPEKILSPVLLCQGTDDWRVVPQQAYDMDAALTRAGKEHKLIVYPGADHSLRGTSYLDDVVQWFQAHPF